MKQYHSNGVSTPWISDKPTKEELERLTINQLLIISKHKKRGLKQALIQYLTT